MKQKTRVRLNKKTIILKNNTVYMLRDECTGQGRMHLNQLQLLFITQYRKSITLRKHKTSLKYYKRTVYLNFSIIINDP